MSIINSIQLSSDEPGFAGYEIVTDDGTISLTISNQSNCCEEWGYDIEGKEGKIGARITGERFDSDGRYKKKVTMG